MGHDLFTLGRTLIGDGDDEMSLAVRVSGARRTLAFFRDFLVGQRERSVIAQPAPVQQAEAKFQLLD
jgi:hypothetical protein